MKKIRREIIIKIINQMMQMKVKLNLTTYLWKVMRKNKNKKRKFSKNNKWEDRPQWGAQEQQRLDKQK